MVKDDARRRNEQGFESLAASAAANERDSTKEDMTWRRVTRCALKGGKYADTTRNAVLKDAKIAERNRLPAQRLDVGPGILTGSRCPPSRAPKPRRMYRPKHGTSAAT
ncbi:hypothetical protein GCM10009735_67510 [Actinomadura chokoriensis]